MEIRQCILTNNECYKQGRQHTVKGIMVHSTGANNPYLMRYVGPDDGILGVNKYGNHWNQFRPDGRQVCVHGFIGLDKDNTVRTYQTLPWGIVGWHSGSGSLGQSKNANNNGYIGFEICEDDLSNADYFGRVYEAAVELCAHLCGEYGLDPMEDIIDHREGHRLGIASNHGDVVHWFSRHGKSMDTLREDVKAKLDEAEDVMYCVQVGAFRNRDGASLQLKQLEDAGFKGFVAVKDR